MRPVYIRSGLTALAYGNQDMNQVSQLRETDTPVFVHLRHASYQSFRRARFECRPYLG